MFFMVFFFYKANVSSVTSIDLQISFINLLTWKSDLNLTFANDKELTNVAKNTWF